MSTILNSYSLIGSHPSNSQNCLQYSEINGFPMLEVVYGNYLDGSYSDYNYSSPLDTTGGRKGGTSVYINANAGSEVLFQCDANIVPRAASRAQISKIKVLMVADDVEIASQEINGTDGTRISLSGTVPASATQCEFKILFYAVRIHTYLKDIVIKIDNEDDNMAWSSRSSWEFGYIPYVNVPNTLNISSNDTSRFFDRLLPSRRKIIIHGFWDNNANSFRDEVRAWLPGTTMPVYYYDNDISAMTSKHLTSPATTSFDGTSLTSTFDRSALALKGFASKDMIETFFDENSDYVSAIEDFYEITDLETDIVNGSSSGHYEHICGAPCFDQLKHSANNNTAIWHEIPISAQSSITGWPISSTSMDISTPLELWAVYGVDRYFMFTFMDSKALISKYEISVEASGHLSNSQIPTLTYTDTLYNNASTGITQINRVYFKGWASTVPDGYTELQYIESDGNTYLNAGGNLRPAQNSNNVYGLYDVVNKTFTTIQGNSITAGSAKTFDESDIITNSELVEITSAQTALRDFTTVTSLYRPILYYINNTYPEGAIGAYNDTTIDGLSLSNYQDYIDTTGQWCACANSAYSGNDYFATYYASNKLYGLKYALPNTSLVMPEEPDIVDANGYKRKHLTFWNFNGIKYSPGDAFTTSTGLYTSVSASMIDVVRLTFNSDYGFINGDASSVSNTINRGKLNSATVNTAEIPDWFNVELNTSTAKTLSVYKGANITLSQSASANVAGLRLADIPDGKELEFWTTTAYNGTGTPDIYSVTDGSAITSDTSLYAHWENSPVIRIHYAYSGTFYSSPSITLTHRTNSTSLQKTVNGNDIYYTFVMDEFAPFAFSNGRYYYPNADGTSYDIANGHRQLDLSDIIISGSSVAKKGFYSNASMTQAITSINVESGAEYDIYLKMTDGPKIILDFSDLSDDELDTIMASYQNLNLVRSFESNKYEVRCYFSSMMNSWGYDPVLSLTRYNGDADFENIHIKVGSQYNDLYNIIRFTLNNRQRLSWLKATNSGSYIDWNDTSTISLGEDDTVTFKAKLTAIPKLTLYSNPVTVMNFTDNTIKQNESAVGNTYDIYAGRYDASIDLSNYIYSSDYFTLLGWSTSSDGSVSISSSDSATLTSDLNLYAIWDKPNQYKLKFYLCDENGSNDAQVEHSYTLTSEDLEEIDLTDNSSVFNINDKLDTTTCNEYMIRFNYYSGVTSPGYSADVISPAQVADGYDLVPMGDCITVSYFKSESDATSLSNPIEYILSSYIKDYISSGEIPIYVRARVTNYDIANKARIVNNRSCLNKNTIGTLQSDGSYSQTKNGLTITYKSPSTVYSSAYLTIDGTASADTTFTLMTQKDIRQRCAIGKSYSLACTVGGNYPSYNSETYYIFWDNVGYVNGATANLSSMSLNTGGVYFTIKSGQNFSDVSIHVDINSSCQTVKNIASSQTWRYIWDWFCMSSTPNASMDFMSLYNQSIGSSYTPNLWSPEQMTNTSANYANYNTYLSFGSDMYQKHICYIYKLKLALKFPFMSGTKYSDGTYYVETTGYKSFEFSMPLFTRMTTSASGNTSLAHYLNGTYDSWPSGWSSNVKFNLPTVNQNEDSNGFIKNGLQNLSSLEVKSSVEDNITGYTYSQLLSSADESTTYYVRTNFNKSFAFDKQMISTTSDDAFVYWASSTDECNSVLDAVESGNRSYGTAQTITVDYTKAGADSQPSAYLCYALKSYTVDAITARLGYYYSGNYYYLKDKDNNNAMALISPLATGYYDTETYGVAYSGVNCKNFVIPLNVDSIDSDLSSVYNSHYVSFNSATLPNIQVRTLYQFSSTECYLDDGSGNMARVNSNSYISTGFDGNFNLSFIYKWN